MSSLRSRLILGFALVAVVPLTVAMLVISQRIRASVQTQAAERLGATLGLLREQLRSDGGRVAERLRILGRDPDLKRLYLLQPTGGRDLADYLAEKRFLLGLDFLAVVDTGGAVVADAAQAPSALGNQAPARVPARPAGGPRGTGPAIENLEGAAALAMAAEAPILYQRRPVGALRGGFLLDAAFLARLKQTSGVELVLRDARNRVRAGTLEGFDQVSIPSRPAGRVEVGGRSYLSRSTILDLGPAPHAGITGLVSTAEADQAVAALQVTSLLLGLLGVGLAVVLGALWSSQVSRPVERLAAFSQRIAQGHWEEPLALHSVRELDSLVSALDRMRRDLVGYREKLRTSERQAAWSQMALKVAHEIKNPLTPIAVSVADLKRSYEQQRPDFPQILDQAVRTIGDEIQTLKLLLQEFSEFGTFPKPRPAPCNASDLMGDLKALYGRELAEGRLALTGPVADLTFTADRGQLKRALVNLIQNGLEATGAGGRVEVAVRGGQREVEWSVSDTGTGLAPEQKAQLFVPYFTTKPHGTGLGLTLVERIVREHEGAIAVDSEPGRGTTFRIRLPLAPGGG